MNLKAYATTAILALLTLSTVHASGHDHGTPITIGIDVGRVYLQNHAQFCTQMDVNIQSLPAGQFTLTNVVVTVSNVVETITNAVHSTATLYNAFKDSRRIDCEETAIAPRLHGSFRVGEWLVLEGSYVKAAGFDFTQSVIVTVSSSASGGARVVPTDAQINKFYNSKIDGSADFSVLDLAARIELEPIPATRMYALIGARRHNLDIEISNVFDEQTVPSDEEYRGNILQDRNFLEAVYQAHADQRSRSGTAYLFGGGVDYEVIDDFSTGIYYGVQFEGERQSNWKFDMAWHPGDNWSISSGLENFAGGEMNDVEFWYAGMTYDLDF